MVVHTCNPSTGGRGSEVQREGKKHDYDVKNIERACCGGVGRPLKDLAVGMV